MATIPIATLTENCWLRCPYFKVEKTDFFEGASVVYRILECENLKRCKYAIEETKKEEEEWNKESAEER